MSAHSSLGSYSERGEESPLLLTMANGGGVQLTWGIIGAVLGGVAVIVVALWALGRVLPRKFTAAAGNALMSAEVFLRPSREKVLEAKQREPKQNDDSGDPPDVSAE
jgi:hypothetical protein